MLLFMKIIYLLSLSFVTLQSCSSKPVMSQFINIKIIDSVSNLPLDDCHCTVIDGAGSQQSILNNPAVISVSRQQGGIHIACNKKGYIQTYTRMGESFEKTTFVNSQALPVITVEETYAALPSFYIISMQKTKNLNF